MNDSLRITGISEIAAGLCWLPADRVMSIWVKYDESGEYDAAGNLLNMTMGGCVTTLEKWQAFDKAWKQFLDDEGFACFHMTDFEAWKAPFNFTLPNGDRDKDRHARILNRVLDMMLDHIEGFHGFGAVSQFAPGPAGTTLGPVTHYATLNDCVNGAVKYAVLDIWEHYQEPLNLVFAKQRHVPSELIGRYLNVYDYGPTEHRIKTHSFAEPKNIYGLQAADVFAYEMGRAQRADRPERYPFKRLREGCKERGLRMTIYWGPIRSSTLILSEARKPSPEPLS